MWQYNCKVTQHGKRQLELDVTYPVTSDVPCADYQLDLYIFSPAQLGLTESRYGVKRFLEDINAYTRFSPPLIPLAKLLDPQCEISPLTRIHRILADLQPGEVVNKDKILYELRMLANIYHDDLHTVQDNFKDSIGRGGDANRLHERLQSFLKEMDAFMGSVRALRDIFIEKQIPEELCNALLWADESISLRTEKEIYRLYAHFQERPDLAASASALKGRLGKEHAYRVSVKYPSTIKEEKRIQNELFLYRENTLKKWAQSALYMSAAPSKTASRIAQLAAGFAAAVAMAFAVLTAILATNYYMIYSLPWVILIVVAYIFKDRIKEMLRGVLMARIPRWIADEHRWLIDRAVNQKVGFTRFRVRFLAPKDLAEPIVRKRDLQANPLRTILPPENVIHFHNDMHLDCATLMKHHTRVESITGIMRLKLDSWLSNMDDPQDTLQYYSGEQMRELQADRVYHVTLVLKLYKVSDPAEPALFKYRLILTRDGIIRIETV